MNASLIRNEKDKLYQSFDSETFGDQQKHYKAKIALNLVTVFDVLFAFALFLLVWEYYHIGSVSFFPILHEMRLTLWHFVGFLIMASVWNRTFAFLRLYQFRNPEGSLSWWTRIVIATAMGATTVITGLCLLDVPGIDRYIALFYLMASVMFFLAYRSLVFRAVVWVRSSRNRNLRNAVIVGTNSRSISLLKGLIRPQMGYNIVGLVDDQAGKKNRKRYDRPILCGLKGFSKYISKYPVDEVIITLPMRSYYDEIGNIIRACALQGIRTRLVNDLFDFQVPSASKSSEWNSASAFIDYDVNERPELQHDLKRLVDIAISGIALVVLSPVYLMIALAILITDGRPVFFIQERIGLNKRRYKMFKFRTMVKNAEALQAQLEAQNEVDGAAFKLTHDPRVTRIGRFLRWSSLDELPQFLNVLIGNMSLVGPRPLPVRDFERFYDDSHRRRFSVKPGITGLWQVSGRSDVDFRQWMNLDLSYVDNWNIFMDLFIIFKTVPAVMMAKGAK